MRHEFVFVLDRLASDDEIDALFDASCDDAVLEFRSGTTVLNFSRAAEHLSSALVSALQDVESVGLRVAAVQSEDLVSVKEIGERTGRSSESVRLLAKGVRGPGGFPPPMSAGGWTLYSWAQVARWLADHYQLDNEYDRILAAADLLGRARAIMRGDAEAAELSKLVA
jgi:hypothetical protein